MNDHEAEEAVATWREYLNDHSPMVDFLVGAGCSVGEALIVMLMNDYMWFHNEAIEEMRRKLNEEGGDDWKSDLH